MPYRAAAHRVGWGKELRANGARGWRWRMGTHGLGAGIGASSGSGVKLNVRGCPSRNGGGKECGEVVDRGALAQLCVQGGILL